MTSKYSAYPAYKDSGVEWLGDVPEHWEIKRLKFFAQISNGQDQKPVVDDNGCYQIYGSGGIFGRSNECLYDQPSVLLGRKGTIDKPLFVTEPFWTVDTMYYTKIYPITSPKFFFYQCLTIQFAMYQYGSALPSMTQESLNGVVFSAPAFDEQRQIADFLDDKTAHLDKLIGQKQQMIGLLNEKRMALITQAVTKGLDLTVPMKDSGVEWLGDVPEHWSVRRLKFLISQPLMYGANEAALDDNPEHPRFIRITDVNKDGSLKDETYKSISWNIAAPYLLQDKDILLARSGATVGKSFMYRESWGASAFAGYLIMARADKQLLLPEYLNYFLNSTYYWQWINSSLIQATIENVSAEKYNNLNFSFPEIAEQQQIAQYLDTETQKIDDMIKTIKQAIATLQEYRTALITAAVTGKIDVRGLHPPTN